MSKMETNWSRALITDLVVIFIAYVIADIYFPNLKEIMDRHNLLKDDQMADALEVLDTAEPVIWSD